MSDRELPQVVRDEAGPMRLMAEADGYVMARRPGCMPFVCSVAEWLARSEWANGRDARSVR